MLTPRQRSLGLHALWAGITLGANRLDRALQSRGAAPGTSVGLTTVGWYALIAGLERVAPADVDWHADGSETRTDGAFLVSTAAAGLGGQALGTAVRKALMPSSRRSTPASQLGPVGGVVVSLLVSDFVHYSLHRLSHEWGPLWRVHSVHHSPERLYWLNATRFHPIDIALEGVFDGFALALCGFTEAQHLTHSTARATYGQLQHCNIEVDSGSIDFALSTPDLHRWHHSEIYAEGDNNYGAVVSVWDRLLGTFFRPGRPIDSKLGVGRMPSFPESFGELLSTPFRWRQIKQANAETWFPDAERS